jgi:hypothetical protein
MREEFLTLAELDAGNRPPSNCRKGMTFDELDISKLKVTACPDLP